MNIKWKLKHRYLCIYHTHVCLALWCCKKACETDNRSWLDISWLDISSFPYVLQFWQDLVLVQTPPAPSAGVAGTWEAFPKCEQVFRPLPPCKILLATSKRTKSNQHLSSTMMNSFLDAKHLDQSPSLVLIWTSQAPGWTNQHCIPPECTRWNCAASSVSNALTKRVL
jgi:hypothetical protein